MSVVILYRIQFEYMYNLSKSGTCDNNILSLLYVFVYPWLGKWNKRDTTDRAKRGVWDEKRGKERKKKKISIVFCT